MPKFDPETQDWINKAREREKPYSHISDERGLEYLLSTGNIRRKRFEVSQGITKAGLVKWKIVNRSVRLPRSHRKLRGEFEYKYARWDPRDPKVSEGSPEFDVKLSRNNPDSQYFPCKEATCGFLVQGNGEECAKTVILRNNEILPEFLESQFYCKRIKPRN